MRGTHLRHGFVYNFGLQLAGMCGVTKEISDWLEEWKERKVDGRQGLEKKLEGWQKGGGSGGWARVQGNLGG